MRQNLSESRNIYFNVNNKNEVKFKKLKSKSTINDLKELAICLSNLDKGNYVLEKLDEIFLQCSEANFFKSNSTSLIRNKPLIETIYNDYQALENETLVSMYNRSK